MNPLTTVNIIVQLPECLAIILQLGKWSFSNRLTRPTPSHKGLCAYTNTSYAITVSWSNPWLTYWIKTYKLSHEIMLLSHWVRCKFRHTLCSCVAYFNPAGRPDRYGQTWQQANTDNLSQGRDKRSFKVSEEGIPVRTALLSQGSGFQAVSRQLIFCTTGSLPTPNQTKWNTSFRSSHHTLLWHEVSLIGQPSGRQRWTTRGHQPSDTATPAPQVEQGEE